MKQALILIFGAVLVYQLSVGFVQGEHKISLYASESPTYAHELPENILSEILTILINGTVHLIANCTIDKRADRVQYWLYTRKIPDGQPISLNSTNFRRPTIILLHGWTGNKDSSYMVVMRKAYLRRYNANVIVMDYGYYVADDYVSSYCKVPRVAQNFAKFLCKLNKYYNLSRLHVVGHSLGGQLAGLSGHLVQQRCGIIGMLTALDPAGPLYQDVITAQRLDHTDAIFVQAVHTNQGQYGYIGNVGDVDFYANCGTYQPGCWQTVVQNITLENIINLPLNYIVCNHQRSCDLFAESIIKNSFLATSIVGPLLCIEDGLNDVDHTYMGEYCRFPQERKSYKFLTNAESPYGKGPDGPLY